MRIWNCESFVFLQCINENEEEMATISEWEHRFVKLYLRHNELRGMLKDSLRKKELYKQQAVTLAVWNYQLPIYGREKFW